MQEYTICILLSFNSFVQICIKNGQVSDMMLDTEKHKSLPWYHWQPEGEQEFNTKTDHYTVWQEVNDKKEGGAPRDKKAKACQDLDGERKWKGFYLSLGVKATKTGD